VRSSSRSAERGSARLGWEIRGIAGVAAVSVLSGSLLSGCVRAKQLSEEQSVQRREFPLIGVDDWIRDDRFGAQRLEPTGPFTSALIADRFDSWAYTAMNPASPRRGSVRAGRVVFGKAEPSHRGCSEGWFALAQGGYACNGGSFRRVASADAERHDVSPALDAALPYDYVQVTTPGAPRYDRIPRQDEERALGEERKARGGPVDVRMEGDYFLAVAEEKQDLDRRFYRTLRDKYVRVEDVETMSVSTLHGKKHPSLPLAFVIGAEEPLFTLRRAEREELGHAPRYSTFRLEQIVEWGQERYAVARDGRAVRASAVRVARAQPRPEGVGAREKWIAVDLSEQTLVAYEGDTPVLATLVSTGKAGHETPTGAFRIQNKFVSTTMSGEDAVDGRYEVEEVPWTMYYDGGYALHGAYWHDQFGEVRSHGCTNLAPADARWLLRWTDPPLPTGWQSIRPSTSHGGTRVYVNLGLER